jgi:arylsulfate sulfotransferase
MIRRWPCLAFCLASIVATSTKAISILNGPTFTPATNAPLAGALQLTTDENSRVSVSVDDSNSGEPWSQDFYDFSTNHVIPLLGFKPGRTNLITVTVIDKNRNQVTADSLQFVTPSLPLDFPNLVLLQSDPARVEPGYTLFRAALNNNRKGYEIIVDSSGEVVWYSPVAIYSLDIRQLANGDLFYFSATNFVEMSMLGQTVRTWKVPTNLQIDQHDGVPTDHGTILYLSDASTVVNNYPTSTTVSNAPTTTANNVVYQRAVEISATNFALLNNWSIINMLQSNRITYLTTLGPPTWDSEHGNAIIEDPTDNSIIVSLRHQNAVIKFYRTSGQLAWIMGPHENWGTAWQPYLLNPVGSPFEWHYGQHTPVLTAQGTIMLYDDGNYRAEPFARAVADTNNYSRAVEYQVTPDGMEISQVWEYGSQTPERFYTDKVGSAEPLPKTGNVLIDFGSVKYINGVAPSAFGPNATMARIQEVTHDTPAELVWDLSVTEYDNTNTVYHDCFVYRSYRMPDLYPHAAAPVEDLTMHYSGGSPILEFSADPTRTYTVQASSDLAQWQDLGPASSQAQPGEYEFEHMDADQYTARFYRVVTH